MIIHDYAALLLKRKMCFFRSYYISKESAVKVNSDNYHWCLHWR